MKIFVGVDRMAETSKKEATRYSQIASLVDLVAGTRLELVSASWRI
jgi:hypothetical protein